MEKRWISIYNFTRKHYIELISIKYEKLKPLIAVAFFINDHYWSIAARWTPDNIFIKRTHLITTLRINLIALFSIQNHSRSVALRDADQLNSFKSVSATAHQRGEAPLLGLDAFNVVSTVSLCKKFSKPVGVKKRLRVNLSR
jgi:hypothetical protein